MFASIMILGFVLSSVDVAFGQNTPSEGPKTIVDYINKDFSKSNPTLVKNNKFLNVANWVAVNDVGSKLTIHENSIRLSDFKSHNYLKFVFDSHNIFNFHVVDKKKIAEKFMNEILSNLIEPEYGDLKEFKNIYGYEFMIYTGARDFTENDSANQPLVYHFFIPKNGIKKMRSLDISVDQLMHQSIVIVNNEKIDL